MFDDIHMIYDSKNQIYTFKGMFGVNFRGYVTNSIIGQKKADLLFRKLSFNEIVIDSFFLLELAEICKYIINGEGPYSSWINVKSIKKLFDKIVTETWMSPNEYDYGSKFKLNMDLVDKTFNYKALDYQAKIFEEYENFKNVLGYNGILLDAATGVGKTPMSLFLATGIEAEVVVMIVMNVSIDATWKKALLNEEMYNKGYHPEESDIYTSLDYYSKKPYTNQKYIIFNYEAIDKLIPMCGSFNYKKVSLIIDEVHNFTSMDSKRKSNLIELAIKTKTKDIILLSGTPIKASTLELIPYLELIDPKFTPVVQNRFKKLYGSPNYILKRCTPIRYGIMSVKIEKSELNLEPVLYKTIDIILKDGDNYTLKSIKEDMIAYIDFRSKEIESNLYKYKNIYSELLEKAKRVSKLPDMAWVEYTNNFNLVCEYYTKRQLMFHTDLVKLVNDFEKVIIIPSLNGDEKKQFKEASVILKYPMLKIRGEVLGIVVLGARIKCHKEMAEQIDYSIIDSTPAKAIIMTSYVEIAETAMNKLKKQKYSPVGIYGENTKNSNALINSFIENENINPLVGTYKSISTGLHLVVANMIVLLDLPFRTYMLDQAIARVHRMGQMHQVIALYTTLNTGEEYNINSRNIDILKWAKDAVEEITGNTIKGLDFEKGKAIDEVIDGLESNNWNYGLESDSNHIWYDNDEGINHNLNNIIRAGRTISGLNSAFEDDDVMTRIYIDVREKASNKLLNW